MEKFNTDYGCTVKSMIIYCSFSHNYKTFQALVYLY